MGTKTEVGVDIGTVETQEYSTEVLMEHCDVSDIELDQESCALLTEVATLTFLVGECIHTVEFQALKGEEGDTDSDEAVVGPELEKVYRQSGLVHTPTLNSIGGDTLTYQAKSTFRFATGVTGRT